MPVHSDMLFTLSSLSVSGVLLQMSSSISCISESCMYQRPLPPLAPVLFPGGKVIMLVKYITKYFHRCWVGFYITLIFLVKD